VVHSCTFAFVSTSIILALSLMSGVGASVPSVRALFFPATLSLSVEFSSFPALLPRRFVFSLDTQLVVAFLSIVKSGKVIKVSIDSYGPMGISRFVRV